MARCRYCDKRGIFLSVDNNGLCKLCAPPVLSDIQQRQRIMQESLDLAKAGKTFGTRLSRYDVLMEHVEHLLEYEKKGIPTLDPSPSTLLRELQPYRDDIILEEASKITEKAKDKSSVAATPAGKYNPLAKALLQIQDILAESESPDLGDELREELKSQMHRVKLDGFLVAADKAAFKGNKKKAIDQYLEALYFVKNDDIPDEQQRGEIGAIERKID